MSDPVFVGNDGIENIYNDIGDVTGAEEFRYSPYKRELVFYATDSADNGVFGYYFAPPNAHGFYRRVGETADHEFAEWITPAGLISYTPPDPATIPASLYWAMNRKTGAWSFAPTVICWV